MKEYEANIMGGGEVVSLTAGVAGNDTNGDDEIYDIALGPGTTTIPGEQFFHKTLKVRDCFAEYTYPDQVAFLAG